MQHPQINQQVFNLITTTIASAIDTATRDFLITNGIRLTLQQEQILKAEICTYLASGRMPEDFIETHLPQITRQHLNLSPAQLRAVVGNVPGVTTPVAFDGFKPQAAEAIDESRLWEFTH